MDQETVEMTADVGVAGNTGPRGPEASPAKVSAEDRFEAENLALRVQVLVLSKEKLVLEVTGRLRAFDAQLEETRSAVRALQTRLTGVYGIDWTKQQVEPGTGNIVPAP